MKHLLLAAAILTASITSAIAADDEGAKNHPLVSRHPDLETRWFPCLPTSPAKATT